MKCYNNDCKLSVENHGLIELLYCLDQAEKQELRKVR